jgi:NTE family protein
MKIGLVLSGGGARGFAHLGVLKALAEQGIVPEIISGVSAGALAGALYGAGHTPDQALQIFLSTKLHRFFRPSVSMRGFLKMKSFRKLYETYLPAQFEELSLPLLVGATDIQAGKMVYFSEGPLVEPLMASCCIPVMFEPMLIDGRIFVDGGIVNNLPAETLLNRCDFIIGVHANPCPPGQALTSMRTVLERSLLLAIQAGIKDQVRLCDVYIEPPALCQFTTLDSSRAREIFDVGYRFTHESAELIAGALQSKTRQLQKIA